MGHLHYFNTSSYEVSFISIALFVFEDGNKLAMMKITRMCL